MLVSFIYFVSLSACKYFVKAELSVCMLPFFFVVPSWNLLVIVVVVVFSQRQI